MIRIERSTPPPPKLLASGSAKLADHRVTVKSRPLTKDDFDQNCYGSCKAWLHASQHGKCCYCEWSRDLYGNDVEHFRPKTRASDERVLRPGYWWLAYEPSNLLFACVRCNRQNKGDKFPLRSGMPLTAELQPTAGSEDPFFIDPLTEDPEEHITFIEFNGRLAIAPLTDRGKRTIAELGLDSDNLNTQRAKLVSSNLFRLASNLEEARKDSNALAERHALDAIEVCVSAKAEFAGMARAFFRSRGVNVPS